MTPRKGCNIDLADKDDKERSGRVYINARHGGRKKRGGGMEPEFL
jgi:hypothetical protein